MTVLPTDRTDPGSRPIRDLTTQECWSLVRTKQVGRLAWVSARGPSVVPVNFVVDDGTVQLHTAAYSEMARECDDSPVAFEVDEIDEAARGGWSVLMRGHAHIDFRVRDAGSTAWPQGSRALLVSIEVEEITGRRVG